MLPRKLDSHMQKSETVSLSFTLYQNPLKEGIGNTMGQTDIRNNFLNRTQKAQY
jgi:hypothetical protein